MLHDLITRLRSLFRRAQVEQDLDEELQYHLERERAKYMQSGSSQQAAERRARIVFGGPEQIYQQCRDARGTLLVENLVQDVSYSVRSLFRNPGFSAVVILTLALGIGSCTAIFSLMTAVLFPPLPYGDVSRLVYVTTPNRHLTDVPPDVLVPDNADFQDLKRENHTFSKMTQFEQFQGNLAQQQAQISIGGASVDGDFFDTIQVLPEKGRAINHLDSEAGHDDVALISHSLWQQMFAGSADALGKTLTLNGKRYRVVGVMPPGFQYPGKNDIDWGDVRIAATDIWVPRALTAKQQATRGLSDGGYALARMRTGVSLEQAGADLSTIMTRLNPLHDPSTFTEGWYVHLKPLRETIEGSARPLMLMLMGAVSFVLLIACANAATLLLARIATRSHELGVRATLGAGRGRLIQQMLTESLVLGACGGISGIGLSVAIRKMLLLLDPGNIPRLQESSLDSRVLLFTILLTLCTSIACGLLPALSSSRINLIAFLKANGQRGAVAGTNRIRGGLIGCEVAAVFVLLAGAGLLLRSYINIQRIPTGFEASTLSLRIDLHDVKPEMRSDFLRSLVQQMRSAPGAIAAGAINNLPFGESHGVGYLWVQDYPNQQGQMVDGASITPGYFSAMGMPLLKGRPFVQEDGSADHEVVIINEAFAKKYFAGRDPIGKSIWDEQPTDGGVPRKAASRVVGVVADAPDLNLEEPVSPQMFSVLSNPDEDYVVIRALLPPKEMVTAAGSILRRMQPGLHFTHVHTMRELVSESTARRRFQTMLLTAFSAMAFLLALVGLYGLTAYAVRLRRPEIGVRIALGASRTHIISMILRQGLRPVVFGLVLGLTMAVALTRLLASFLFGVNALDPITFVIVPALLLLVTIAACLVPAREASLADPVTILRYE